MGDINSIYNFYEKLETVSIDTRHLKPASMFFALKGPNFNGNLFIEQAFERGAAYCIVDEKESVVNDRCLLVGNVLTTLQELATHHRKRMAIPVIAIAGSNGKTTTKELVGAVLEKRYKTFSTKGNLNNHIGLPVSLLSIKKETEIAVVELGANHIGETAALCNIAIPDHGLVTNNGKDHLEGYGSLEGVRKANSELYDFLRQIHGVALVSTLQKDLMEDSSPIKRYTYGDNDANISGRIVDASPFLVVNFKEENGEKEYTINTKLTGAYNYENVMAAVAVGLFFGVDEDEIVKAIEHYKPANNRSQWLSHAGNDFIVDCYNANPSSMQLAIENLASMNTKKNKIVVLGDMHELGTYSDDEHIYILQLARSKNFEKIILVGPEFNKVNKRLGGDAETFTSVDEVKQWFANVKPNDNIILLKGSRAMTLEKILEK